MHMAFIGFGEAARAFQESLHILDPSLRFSAYDILLDNPDNAPAMLEAMKDRGVAVALAGSNLEAADIVFSAVTADQCGPAATAAASWLRAGQIFIDINSVSPGQKRANAEGLAGRSVDYVDMAVMAPVHPRGHKTPLLLAGDVTDRLFATLDQLGFDFETISDSAGDATAIKMVRSMFVKGLEAITVETLSAASKSGCFDYTWQSLQKSFPGLAWPDFAHYQFERTTQHGKRRAAEMRECARTFADLGLSGALGDAIADVQQRMGDTKEIPPEIRRLSKQSLQSKSK